LAGSTTRLAALLLTGLSLAGAAPAGVDLDIRIENLRSLKGAVRLCLTQNPAHFPDCKSDPAAKTLSLPAGTGVAQFKNVAPGQYALSAFHDENANGKLDKMAIVPREGFGFSRNPVIRFGPPAYKDAQFTVNAGAKEQRVKIRYML
jgi:uncharacterized protein (DUF2141 family)